MGYHCNQEVFLIMSKRGGEVIRADDIEFVPVDWGRTKELVGLETGRSELVQVKITEYLPGYVHKKHVHPEQDEVIFVLSGQGYSETAAGRKRLEPNSVAVVPRGVEHATYNPEKETLRAIIIKSPPDQAHK